MRTRLCDYYRLARRYSFVSVSDFSDLNVDLFSYPQVISSADLAN
jgi:hypothetical protein